MWGRNSRHDLRDQSGKLVGGRVARCGKKPIMELVQLRLHKTLGASYAGLETCGSVWACPVCAAKIAEGRRVEVGELIGRHMDAGGEVYMAAFTVPHHAFQAARELRQVVAKSWQKVLAGKPWVKFKDRYGLVGVVRALEVTHGAAGWHPHLHCLFLVEKPLGLEATWSMGEKLFLRWRAKIEAAGYGECTAAAWKFEKVMRPEAATDYVTKWGADSEIAKAHIKLAKGGGRSPWQLLESSAAGDRQAAVLFKEYAAAFFGARHLTWTRGLRERYGLRGEARAAELAAEHEPSVLVGTLRAHHWRVIVRRRLTAQLLNVLEMDGWAGVLRWMEEYGIFGEASRAVRHRGGTGPPRPDAVDRQAGGGASGGDSDLGGIGWHPDAHQEIGASQ